MIFFLYDWTSYFHWHWTVESYLRIHLWWRHHMETFSTLLGICAGNSPVPGEFPAKRPVTRSLDVFFDLRLNQRLSKQSWGWWFETLPRPLWRHCNVICGNLFKQQAPSHHLNQWWCIIDLKLQLEWKCEWTYLLKKINFKICMKCGPYCRGHNVFTDI